MVRISHTRDVTCDVSVMTCGRHTVPDATSSEPSCSVVVVSPVCCSVHGTVVVVVPVVVVVCVPASVCCCV